MDTTNYDWLLALDARQAPHADTATVFEPHHKTEVAFPQLRLRSYAPSLEDAPNLAIMRPPVMNMGSRYGPSPLIPDDAVAAHAANPCSEEETDFYSRTKASMDDFETVLAMGCIQDEVCDGEDSIEGLVRHLDIIKHVAGMTTLHALAWYRDAANDENNIFFCVERRTSYKDGDENYMAKGVYYGDCSRGMWAVLLQGEQWQRDLCDLFFGRSDRAVRHLQVNLAAARMNELLDDPGWKAPRLIRYDRELLQTVGRPLIRNMNPNNLDCISCGDDFDRFIAVPVRLPCGHVYCKICVRRWCEANRPANANCPSCRALIFSPASIIELTYGTEDGVYLGDDERYDAYEHAERSSADIDHDLAENSSAEIRIDRQFLLSVFDHLTANADLETAQSTPFHLQTQKVAPEWALLRHHLDLRLQELDKTVQVTKHVYNDLMDFVQQWMVYQMWVGESTSRLTSTGSANTLVSDADLDAAWQHLDAVGGLPPGWSAGVERVVSRILMFYHLRQCDCEEQEYQTLHHHGLRMHWLPEPDVEALQHGCGHCICRCFILQTDQNQ